MRYLRAFGRFWFDFIVGEDWRIAAGVVTVLALGALALRAELLSDSLLAVLIATAIVAVVVVSVVGAGYRSANRP
ncbi:MAG: hypothetical protein QOK00_260 [Thermoleophilaceae bacterium]|jgi:hypothetical protein|nr:hypothetical protein [Thermoleophilaceae bacterium]